MRRAGTCLHDASRIVVCLRYGIGDVVMQFPVLEALRRAVPDAQITALAAEPAIELLQGAGLADETVAYSRWGIQQYWDTGHEFTTTKLTRWFGEQAFDLSLDANCAPQIVCSTIKRIGVAELNADDSVLRAAISAGANSTEALARAARAGWGLAVSPHARPAIAISDSEAEFARGLLHSDVRPFIAFCPAGSSNLKRWPESKFAAVADWAIEGGYDAAVFAGDREEHVVSRMQRAMAHGDRIRIVRGLHLRRVAAALARGAALVSNDTGLMHIAASVGTPVVAVFGPTSARVYLPGGRAIGLAARLECPHRGIDMNPAGCWASEHCLIGPESCTAAVATPSVIAALGSLLNTNREARRING